MPLTRKDLEDLEDLEDLQDVEDLQEKYGWQPGERDALQAEMAERQRRIAYEKSLAWCHEQRRERERAAAQPEPRKPKRESQVPDSTELWGA